MKKLKKRELLGVGITDASKTVVLEYIFNILKKKTEKLMIVTPNPEILTYAASHEDYKKILNQAALAIPDGTGLMFAGLILGNPLQERITGTDLLLDICKKGAEKGITVGLLGAMPGIAEKAADCLREKYPGLNIVFAAAEWTEENRVTYNNYNQFNNYKVYIDLLFVAYGAPKQEEWIRKHLTILPVTAAMGVGGAFDFISGNVPRAPVIVRKTGMEWLYRLIREPWRWRRQTALLEFLWLVLKTKLKHI